MDDGKQDGGEREEIKGVEGGLKKCLKIKNWDWAERKGWWNVKEVVVQK